MVSGKHPEVPKENLLKRLKRFGRTIHFWRLLSAFLLAIATCVVMHSQGNTSSYAAQSVVRGVKIVVDNAMPASGLYIVPNQSFEVNLRIAVNAFQHSSQYHPEQFVIQLDGNRLLEKLHAKPLNSSAEPLVIPYEVQTGDVIEKPRGVKVRDDAIVGTIKVKCDRMGGKDVPVHLRLDRRKEKSGWTYECRLLNEMVHVTGPQFLLARLDSISTELVEVSGEHTYEGMVSLALPSELSALKLSSNQVEYEVRPQKDTRENVTRAFNLPVFFLMRENSQLQPVINPGELQRSVEVRLHGPAKILKNLDIEKLRVYGDMTDKFMEGKHNVSLQVIGLPDGVKLEGISPQDVLTIELGYRHGSQLPEEIIPLQPIEP